MRTEQQLRDQIALLKTQLEDKECELANESIGAQHKYCCSVSGLIMLDPVVAPSGTSYERASLVQWANACRSDNRPITEPNARIPYVVDNLPRNNFLRDEIIEKYPVVEEIRSLREQIKQSEAALLRLTTQSNSSLSSTAGVARRPRGSLFAFSAQPVAAARLDEKASELPAVNQNVREYYQTHSKQPSYDYLMKLLLVGDSCAGKSELLLRFSDETFTTSFITTPGIDFKIKTVAIDGIRVKFQIWDTAGQDRFRTITTAYYRGAMGILLVYAVSDRNSFLNIRNWFRNAQQHAAESTKFILVGTLRNRDGSGDITEDERQVPFDAAQALAAEYGTTCFECSARTGLNVEQAFKTLAINILNSTDTNHIPAPAQIAPDPEPKKKCSLM